MADSQGAVSVSLEALACLSRRFSVPPPGPGPHAVLARHLQSLFRGAFNHLREYTQTLHEYLDESARDRARLQTEIERLRTEIDELKRKISAPQPVPERLDRFYLQFQDRFRGSPDQIKSRLTVYLPVLGETEAGQADMPLLDLACGRGEWLELLRSEGLSASGVDANSAMVASCRERGLSVDRADVLEYLRGQRAECWGAITAFHLIEHLDFLQQVEFVDLALAALKPGGILILETPNPRNLQVATHTFYIDPTHTRPVPPLELSFLLEARGFKGIRIMPLNPYPESCRMPLDGTAGTARLNDLLYGPQDYGVVARKE